MIADTLELYRKYTGEETFSLAKSYDTMAQMWQERSEEYADRTAVEDNGKSYTFRTLAEDAAKFRTVLKNRGAKPSRIAILVPNSYDFVKAFIAVTTLGCTAVVLPAHLGDKAVFGCVSMFGAEMLITAPATEGAAALVAQARPDVPVVSVEETSEETTPCAQCSGSDGCAIVMTGGTTGSPKGALLSNAAVMQGTLNSCLGVPGAFYQRYMLVLPLSHVFGLIRNMLASLYSGSTLFICRENRNMFRDAAQFKPTFMVLVPALAEMALTLSKKFGKNMFGDSLRVIICGAANVPPYLISEYKKLGVELYPGYGLTESANLVSGNPENHKKPDSVGLIFPGMEYQIVDGELWLKGRNMMDCYVGREEPEAYSDGWFRTGDLVRMDDEGFLYITGRIKEVIVLPNGENISPAELEAKFNTLEYIQDSQVFEDVDDAGKHFLALEVVPRATETAKLGDIDLNAFLIAELRKINAELPSFARVSKITVRTSDFERTPSMKIVRYKKCQ